MPSPDQMEKMRYVEAEIAAHVRRGDVGAKLASSAETNGCEASRQKYWSELKEHERIDRTREVVKLLEIRLEMAEAFIRTLMEHKHDAGGLLCGPFNPYQHMPKPAQEAWMGKSRANEQANPDAVYF